MIAGYRQAMVASATAPGAVEPRADRLEDTDGLAVHHRDPATHTAQRHGPDTNHQ